MSSTPEQSQLHPSVVSVLKFFTYSHLPEHLQSVSYACYELAQQMVYSLPQNAELTIGLRELLEAKDCFVCASLPQERGE